MILAKINDDVYSHSTGLGLLIPALLTLLTREGVR
jgi:hypothetical protein